MNREQGHSCRAPQDGDLALAEERALLAAAQAGDSAAMMKLVEQSPCCGVQPASGASRRSATTRFPKAM